MLAGDNVQDKVIRDLDFEFPIRVSIVNRKRQINLPQNKKLSILMNLLTGEEPSLVKEHFERFLHKYVKGLTGQMD